MGVQCEVCREEGERAMRRKLVKEIIRKSIFDPQKNVYKCNFTKELLQDMLYSYS